MALDFPNSPIVGQEFSASGKTWRWNGSKWISSTSALQLTTLNDVGDVTITAVSNGQVIKWNGSAWVNAADNAGTTISSIDDINDVTITSVATGQFLKWDGTAWVNDAIDLGTDTTGNYVSGLTQGTGVTVTHTPSEGSSPTIAIGQDVSTSASVTFLKVETTGDVVVGGNLTVNGTTTTLNTETLAVEDNIVVLNSNVTSSPSTNAGIEVERGTSANVLIRWNETNDQWEFTNDGTTYGDIAALGSIELGTDTTGNFVSDITQGTGVTVTHTPGEGSSPTVAIGQAVGTSASVTFAHVSAPVTGNVTGNVTGSSGSTTGNAATATALQSARTISLSGDVSGSVSFDGTSNVSISATVEPNSVALGTDTTGNYVNDLTAGTGITVTHTPSEGSSPTVAIGQSVATSASVTFAKLDTTGDITVGGNLTVNGTTTTLNTETLAIEDNIVVLNSGVTGSPTVNAGIEVERGTSANVDLRWNESTDKWEFTNDGSTYSNLGAGGATISDTPPSSPVTGQIWYESDTGKTFVYYDSFWIEIVGSTGAQGPTGATGAEGGTTTLTTKGDLLTRSASAVARLPVGATNGHVLTVDSEEASGMKWAASSGGGSSEDSISPFLLMGA
jgi:hypothetical protein